jgi:hypothetical protein
VRGDQDRVAESLGIVGIQSQGSQEDAGLVPATGVLKAQTVIAQLRHVYHGMFGIR